MTSTISSKGQITVPKAVRDRLGLRAGTRVDFELIDRGVVVRKGRATGRRVVDELRGSLPRRAATDALVDEMRGARLSAAKARR
jgi:antitoxin PrlF